MTERKGGLGRGLAALIPQGPAGGAGRRGEAADATRPGRRTRRRHAEPAQPSGVGGRRGVPRDRRPTRSRPNPKQPRQVFDEDALAELEHSIREFGLMQPIVVRELGRRRPTSSSWASAGCVPPSGRTWPSIPAIVRQTADDAMLRDALLENIHRVQLNPLEEAAAYQQLLDEFEVTHERARRRASGAAARPSPTPSGCSSSPSPCSGGSRRACCRPGTPARCSAWRTPGAQEELAARIVAEGLSVRATEEAVTLAQERGAAEAEAGTPQADAGAGSAGPRRAALRHVRHPREGRARPRKGKIVVEFGSVDDLERIVELMAKNGTNQTS